MYKVLLPRTLEGSCHQRPFSWSQIQTFPSSQHTPGPLCLCLACTQGHTTMLVQVCWSRILCICVSLLINLNCVFYPLTHTPCLNHHSKLLPASVFAFAFVLGLDMYLYLGV